MVMDGFNVLSDAMVVARPKHPPAEESRTAVRNENYVLDQAIVSDSRHSESHFRIGAVLFIVSVFLLILNRRHRMAKSREQKPFQAEEIEV